MGERRIRQRCRVRNLSPKLPGDFGNGSEIGLMIGDHFGDLSGESFQLLVRRHEIHVAFESLSNLSCRAARLCETLLRRQHRLMYRTKKGIGQ